MVAFPREIDEMNAAQVHLREAWLKREASAGTFKRLHEERIRTLWSRAVECARAVLDWRLHSIDSGVTKYVHKGAMEVEKGILTRTTPEEVVAAGLGKDFAELVAFCQGGEA